MPEMRHRRKRSRVIMRAKVKRRLLGMFASMLAVAVLAGAVFYFSGPALSALRRMTSAGKNKFTSWRVRSIRVLGVDEVLSAKILDLIHLEPGQLLSLEESGNLVSRISSGFPFLAGTKISRNWLNGALVVKTSVKSAVCRVIVDGRESGYLGEDGKIFSAPAGLYENLIPVNVFYDEKAAADFTPSAFGEGLEEVLTLPTLDGLARFMKEFRSRKNFLPFKLSGISCSPVGEECILNLSDGSKILWGAYEFMEEKIARLDQVLTDAGSRFPGPVRIDLRYFGDGRILLNRIELAAAS